MHQHSPHVSHHTHKEKGFALFIFVVIIGIIAALYLLKDEQGVRYGEKLIKQKDQVIHEVDGYKQKMDARDKEIKENL